MATHKPIKWARAGKVAGAVVAGVVALATGAVVIQRLPPRDGSPEEDGQDQGQSGKDPVAHLSSGEQIRQHFDRRVCDAGRNIGGLTEDAALPAFARWMPGRRLFILLPPGGWLPPGGPRCPERIVRRRAGPGRRGNSPIRCGVTTAPAAPPATPDRAATGVEVRLGTVAAACTRRRVVLDRGSRCPARHVPAHLDPLLPQGAASNLEAIQPLPTGLTPDAEPGQGHRSPAGSRTAR
jgi:hypothetical protein